MISPLAPVPFDFERFRGVVRKPSPGLLIGAAVEIRADSGGWHIYVRNPGHGSPHLSEADIWCDDWADVLEWSDVWDVAWTVVPAPPEL